MSVIGIDFGNESCYVAVAKGGGIETVDNDYSLRATSSTVAFSPKARILGVSAKNQLSTNLKNTVYGFKRFLGRPFEDPIIQEQMKKLPFKVVPHQQTGGAAVQVSYLGTDHVFTAEQITAMLFTKLKIDTEVAVKGKISECVISVPSYFTDVERKSLLAAAQMAGLNVLRILNETSATALCYGIYKQDLPAAEEKPRNVVFVDCGHSALQVSAVAFNKGKLKILASSADPNLGGRDFDNLLAAHFCAEFKEKYKIDALSNFRSYVRILAEVEKLKKQMSANATKLPLNMDLTDIDVSSSICRADFEAMASHLFDRVGKTLRQCLEDSKLQGDDIYAVEIVGGSSRIPFIKQLIEQIFNKAPSTTLNQDEAVARGCALQCAILSPSYKVRDFGIADVQPYPIKLIWDESVEDGFAEVFPQYHPFPFSRIITMYKKEPFSLKAMYNSPVPFSTQELGTYTINDVKSPDGGAVKIKVKTRININGIFSVALATAYEKTDAPEVEPMETEPPTESNGTAPQGEQGLVNGSETGTATETTDVPMAQDDQPTQEKDEGTEESKEDEKKKGGKKQHYKTLDLPIIATTLGLTPKQVELMTETEGQMIAEDKLEKERIDCKNALEEYVYYSKDVLMNSLTEYVEKTYKDQLYKNVLDLEEWLYEEGADERKHVYSERLNDLKQSVEPLIGRKSEALNRPDAIREYEIAIQLARKVIDMHGAKDARYAHLEPSEIEKVKAAITQSDKWLDDLRNVVKNLKPYQDCPTKVSDIVDHRRAFEKVSSPIINKPQPKVEPPKKDPPKKESKKKEPKTEEPAGTDNNTETGTETTNDQNVQMDLD